MPPPGSEPLHFANRYSRTLPQQFAICLWRNRQAYWCVRPAGLPTTRLWSLICCRHVSDPWLMLLVERGAEVS